MTSQQLSTIQFGDIQPSKSGALEVANKIANAVIAGFLDPVDTAVLLNAIKLAADEALSAIRQPVVDQLEQSQGKATVHGCKVEKAELGVKYDYSANESWVSAKQVEDKAAEDRKALEGLLKSIPAGKSIFNDEGIELIGPSKSSTTGFKTTLAK